LRVICSFCRKVIKDAKGAPATAVSHGMCPQCGEYFERLWGGMPLGDYLDLLPRPVLIVDGEGRLVAANRRIAEAVCRDKKELRGLLAGEAMACVHSRLPEGCGKTTHCRDCAIRQVVLDVVKTAKPVTRRAAWVQKDEGRVPLCISARPVQNFVEVTIEEREEQGADRTAHA
jgi:PAS domain-containing protein